MGKDDNERVVAVTVGRVRGLHDIRTLGSLRRSQLPRPQLPAVDVRIVSARTPPRSVSEFPPQRPQAWIFVKRPRFSRYQGMLLVDRMAEPHVDVFEEEQALVVLVELPGIREGDIDVQVNGNVLTISTRPTPDRRRYYRKLLLPFLVSTDNIQRALHNNVLKLELGRTLQDGAAERKQS